MLPVLKRMALGCSLSTIASAVLLFSDLSQRKAAGTKIPRVAIFHCASAAVLDDGVQGIRELYDQAGYVNGKNIELRMFNA